MEGSEGLAYDDLWSDSNAMVMGVDCPWGPVLLPCTPSHATLHMLGSPMDQLPPMEVEIALELHMTESELDNL